MTRKRLPLSIAIVAIVAVIAVIAATSGGAQKNALHRPGAGSSI